MFRVKIRFELDPIRLPQIMKSHREILEIPESQDQVRFQLLVTRPHYQGNMIKIFFGFQIDALHSDWLKLISEP